mmetsp:Transcript_16134/g.48514  ORF Transcript_16134/g.48514 Transcript_16134/m.48514 type:complete len:150 (+) Transcript_16134:56-505(+)
MGSDAEAKARGRWRGLLAPAILLVVYALWLAQHYRGRTRSRRRRGHPDNIFGSAFDREAFARADRDASAAIDADELAEALKALNLPLEEPAIQQVFSDYDLDGDRLWDATEIKKLVARACKPRLDAAGEEGVAGLETDPALAACLTFAA